MREGELGLMKLQDDVVCRAEFDSLEHVGTWVWRVGQRRHVVARARNGRHMFSPCVFQTTIFALLWLGFKGKCTLGTHNTYRPAPGKCSELRHLLDR